LQISSSGYGNLHKKKEVVMPTATLDREIKQDSPDVNLMPPAVFFSCLILGGVLEFVFPIDFTWLSHPVRLILGLAIACTGFALMMLAHEKFKRVETQVPTNQPASRLVIHGPYRFSRNPMYVGGIAFFMGMGIAAGSLWLLAASFPLTGYISLYVVPREEGYMERAFGAAYRDYCQNVRRWL
jgi:protein-S-isoprenylcysteine O-methyltransferase Ste14